MGAKFLAGGTVNIHRLYLVFKVLGHLGGKKAQSKVPKGKFSHHFEGIQFKLFFKHKTPLLHMLLQSHSILIWGIGNIK